MQLKVYTGATLKRSLSQVKAIKKVNYKYQ